MAIQGTTTAPPLDDAEPPFLQEATEAIAVDPVRQPIDRVVDFVYQWRLALGLGLIPVFLAVLALAYDPRTPDDPVLTAGDGETSSFEAIVQGVVPDDGSDESAAAALDGSADDSQAAGQQDDGSQDEQGPALPRPSDTTPTTAPTTTDTTASSTTESTAPPTTEPTTSTTVETTAPTTAPPITVVECLITLDRKESPLYARPSRDSDKIDKVERGTYAGFTREDNWYLIDYRGTAGWIRAKHVEDVQGEC